MDNRFPESYVIATVAEYDPIEWGRVENREPREAFARWAANTLTMREVSDAQLAARWRAFREGWVMSRKSVES